MAGTAAAGRLPITVQGRIQAMPLSVSLVGAVALGLGAAAAFAGSLLVDAFRRRTTEGWRP
jgi:hypothetical protein